MNIIAAATKKYGTSSKEFCTFVPDTQDDGKSDNSDKEALKNKKKGSSLVWIYFYFYNFKIIAIGLYI